MKVIVSNKIYLKPDDALREKLEKNLTYQVVEAHSKRKIPKLIRHFGLVGNGTYWMPVTRTDLLEGIEGIEYRDKRVEVPANIPQPKFTLRDDQINIYNDVEDTCLINGKPG